MLKLALQRELEDVILKERLETIVGPVMEKAGVECWLNLSREYNEDPLFHALTPSHYPTARRITMLAIIQKDGECIRYSVSMPDHDLQKYYVQAYDMKNETQMEALLKILEKHDPKTIAINMSDHFAFTDGLSVGLYRMLMKDLPKKYTDRFISSDVIGIEFLEKRTQKEIEVYPDVMKEALNIIAKAFSDEVIKPGVTSCQDVMDFMAQEVNNLGVDFWFEPTIDLQNKDGKFGEDTIIQRGDLLHCDFGIRYLNLCTDTQRLCYVCKEGEDAIPQDLLEGFKENNRFQDIVIENMKIGKTGNEVFLDSIKQGKEEGIDPMLYTHPLGFNGHGAGPTIGLFSNQNSIPVRGDLKLNDCTGYALELNTKRYSETYGREIYFFTEESILFVDNKVIFLAEGRDKMFMVKGE